MQSVGREGERENRNNFLAWKGPRERNQTSEDKKEEDEDEEEEDENEDDDNDDDDEEVEAIYGESSSVGW